MKRSIFALSLLCANLSFAQDIDSLTQEAWEITCYPNPTSDLLMVKSNREIQDIQIFDLNGSLVKAPPMPNWCFSLHDLPSGWLFVYVVGRDGNIEKRNIYKN